MRSYSDLSDEEKQVLQSNAARVAAEVILFGNINDKEGIRTASDTIANRIILLIMHYETLV